MKRLKTILINSILCCYISIASAQYITVDDTKTAQQLVENVLVNSSCANVSNFSISGDNYSPGQNSYAYFNSGTSNFPFKEGVVLSTWSSINSIGPYISNSGGGNASWAGDSDLEYALNLNAASTINGTSLEFDFTPLTNFINFNYLFASNEYQKYFPCVYSDGFAFLIKEKGGIGNYQNLALLPGTVIPVSSTNVHPLIPDLAKGCPAINEAYFAGYNGLSSPVNYSGQTVVLNAKTNVIAGQTYHIKLVISDNQNVNYDSAIFLEAGSFLPKIDFGPDRSIAANTAICFGDSYIIDTGLSSSLGYSYKWYKDAIAIPFANNPSLSVNVTGTYKVEVSFTTGCMIPAETRIEFTPKIDLKDTTLVQCDDDTDGISLFDLTKADAIIKNNITNLSSVVYYKSLADAKATINSITTPATYKNTSVNQSVFARVTNSYGCANYAEVKLQISSNPIALQTPISICDTDGVQDGFSQFDLDSQASSKILNGLPLGLVVEYYLNTTDAIAHKNKLTTIFKNTVNPQTI